MSKLTAYKCLECGHYTISKYDGKSCEKCKSRVVPVGDATYSDNKAGLTVNVSVKDTELFKRMIKVFVALMDDKHTPEWIKEKIKRLILDEIKED